MVEGLESLKARFAALPQKVQEVAEKALDDSARELAMKAARNAPVDDGDLRESIRWSRTVPNDGEILNKNADDRAAAFRRFVIAGNEATIVKNKSGGRFQNARIQEYGTKARKARPYFRPAINSTRKTFYNRMKRRIMAAIRNG